MNTTSLTRESFPMLMSAKHLQMVGFSRDHSYALLNRSDVPVIPMGKRRFVNRDLFFKWLDAQAEASMAGMEGLHA